jgi:hypothetical protein
LKKGCSSRYRRHLGLQEDKKRTSPQHIIVKTLGIWSKGKLKVAKQRYQVTYRRKPLEDGME